MVTRGGLPGDAKSMFPKGTFISSDDFRSARELARYLKSISVPKYAKMLEKKDQYVSIGFKQVYQHALCSICYKMNCQDRYRKTITDIESWVQAKKYCLKPSEVNDL